MNFEEREYLGVWIGREFDNTLQTSTILTLNKVLICQ